MASFFLCWPDLSLWGVRKHHFGRNPLPFRGLFALVGHIMGRLEESYQRKKPI